MQNTFDYMAPADKYIPISGQFLNLFVLRAFRFINNESIFTLIVGSLQLLEVIFFKLSIKWYFSNFKIRHVNISSKNLHVPSRADDLSFA